MTERREDKAFEDFLDGRSPLSESYARLKDVEPPAGIDRRILAEARAEAREAARSSSRRTASWWRPWPALATVVITGMAVMLSLDLLRTQSFEMVQMPVESPSRSVSARLPSAEVSTLEQDGPAAAPPATATDDEDGVMLEKRTRKYAVSPDTTRTRISAQMTELLTETDESRPEEVPSAQAPADPDETDASRFTTRQSVDAAGLSAAHKSATGNQAAGQVLGQAPATARSMTAVTEAAQQAVMKDALAVAKRRVDERRSEKRERDFAQVTQGEPSPSRMSAAMPPPQAEGEHLPTSALSEDPELWLEFIDVLVEEGHEDLATEETQAFKKAFPDRALAPRHETLLGD